MAQTKKVKKLKSTPLAIPSDKQLNTEVKSLMGKSRVWVGLAIVLLVLGAGMYIKNANSKGNNSSQVIDLVSPQPTVAGKVVPVSSPTAKPAVIMKKVATLADTNGKVEVTVQGGDSFWKISEKACGTGRYFLDIQSQLGYTNRTIHAGDKLIVQCPN